MSEPALSLVVLPDGALIDEPLDVRVEGAAPGARVELSAEMKDHRGRVWSSSASFLADADGVVALRTSAPIEGSYTEADPCGLCWSMRPDTTESPDPFFALDGTQPLGFELDARSEARTPAFVSVQRSFCGAGVTEQALELPGIVGRLYLPAGAKASARVSAVLVAGGSEGGMGWSRVLAALLASHGHAALAVGYFGAPGLPEELVEIDLGVFEPALAWLCEQPEIDATRVGVLGGSKGGELALLLAARHTKLRAVAAFVPSAVVFQGLPKRRDRGAWTPRSSWSDHGVPLPFVRYQITAAILRRAIVDALRARATPLRASYEAGMQDFARMTEAAIPVERIAGPVLLLSSPDDALWPSDTLSEMVMTRLRAARHAHADKHVSYPGAGHHLFAPGLPTTVQTVPFGPLSSSLGGDPPRLARAQREAWAEVLRFFEKNLAAS